MKLCENSIAIFLTVICTGVSFDYVQGDCPESMFRCDDGTCIRQQWLCDGEADCIDQSDEENCTIGHCPEFKCDSGECIPERWRCDGVRDCYDRSDEEGCQTNDPCDIEPDNYFRCNVSSKCISLSSTCDSVYDCGPEDTSDEEQCHQEPNRPPSIYYQPPDVVYFKPREAIELKCIADGMPLPKYRWTKNSIEFKPDDTDNGRIVQIQGKGTIVIHCSESTDEGLYQCSAVNEFGTSISIKVNLIEGMIDVFPSSENRQLLVDKGTSITLPCTPPRSVPAAKIYWILKQETGKFEPVKLDNRITSDLEGRLYITNVKEEDFQEGNYYACMAMNNIMREMQIGPGTVIIPAGSTDKSVPPYLLWSSPNQVLGMLGESLKLKCIYGGNPTSEVHWESSTSGSIPDNRRHVSSGGQELFIAELAESDSGSYTCYIMSTNGSRQHRNINVVIKAKPYWIDEPRDIESSVGASATFKCRAGGTPSPSHQWFINGVKLQYSHDLSHFGDRFTKINDNEITVVNLKKSDMMVLQCNASNIYDYVFADFYLNIID